MVVVVVVVVVSVGWLWSVVVGCAGCCGVVIVVSWFVQSVVAFVVALKSSKP
mgnify:FL=1